MITYFTTAKNFTGKTRTAQLNAVGSWLQSVQGSQVIVFGKCEGIEELSGREGVLLVPDVQTSPEGTPRIDDMFIKAQLTAENDICCFLNADIIITAAFARALIDVHRRLKKNYLLVGERLDIDLEQKLDFGEDWEKRFLALIDGKAAAHPPLGSDYFAFPRGQYTSMPALLVGRAAWDLWMIFDGRVKGMKVVDLTETVLIYHQNHDYKHRKKEYASYFEDEEALANMRFLPPGELYDYTLFACNYSLRQGRITRSFARGDLRLSARYERRILWHRIKGSQAGRLVLGLLSRIAGRKGQP